MRLWRGFRGWGSGEGEGGGSGGTLASLDRYLTGPVGTLALLCCTHTLPRPTPVEVADVGPAWKFI